MIQLKRLNAVHAVVKVTLLFLYCSKARKLFVSDNPSVLEVSDGDGRVWVKIILAYGQQLISFVGGDFLYRLFKPLLR